MIAADLERLLIAHGAAGRKTRSIMDELRKANQLPVEGRGRSAALITSEDAAKVIVALAGSTKATEAATRLLEMQELTTSYESASGQMLLDALVSLLDTPGQADNLVAVRIARTTRHATFLYSDRPAFHFGPGGVEPEDGRFYVEGVITGRLLRLIALAFRAPPRSPTTPTAENDADSSMAAGQ